MIIYYPEMFEELFVEIVRGILDTKNANRING